MYSYRLQSWDFWGGACNGYTHLMIDAGPGGSLPFSDYFAAYCAWDGIT